MTRRHAKTGRQGAVVRDGSTRSSAWLKRPIVVGPVVLTLAAAAAVAYFGGPAIPSLASLTDYLRLSPPAATRVSLPLPDLARLDRSVQERMREQHAASAAAANGDGAPRERAEAVGAYGRLLLAAEYVKEAATVFQQASALAPADMRWPYYLAHAYRVQQELAPAIDAFERAVTLAPGDVPSLIWLGELHLARGDVERAERALSQALAVQPDSAAAMARLGQAAIVRRDYRAAIDHLERALRLQPEAAGLHYPLAMAYRGAGNVTEAEVHLHRAGGSGSVAPPDPLMDVVAGLLDNAAAFEARGMAALDARNWTVAVDHLRRAAAMAPANAVTRLNLGTALSLAGEPDLARRELLEAVRLQPGLAKAHFSLGVLAQDAGRLSEAIERFATAVRHDPGFADAHFTLAEAVRRSGRAGQSIRHYDEVLRLNPAASQARFGRAMAFVQLRRYGEAGEALRHASQAHPDQPGFPHALARLLAAAPEAAVRDGSRALALMQPLVQQQQSAALSETMAMALAELGRFDEAVEWQQRAIRQAAEAGHGGLASRMQDNLALYRRRQPCRTPWRADDPVIAVAG